MTENQTPGMPAEELAIELMTSTQHMAGGRAEALRLLDELRLKLGREIAGIQRTAHNEMRPSYHSGLPCNTKYDCHVSKVIALAEDEQ